MKSERSTFKDLLQSCNAVGAYPRGFVGNQASSWEKAKRVYEGIEPARFASLPQDHQGGTHQKLRWERPQSARPATGTTLRHRGLHKSERDEIGHDRLFNTAVAEGPGRKCGIGPSGSGSDDSSALWSQSIKHLLDGRLFSFGAKPDVECMLQTVRQTMVQMLQCERAAVYLDLRGQGFLFKNGWNGVQFSPNRGLAGHVFLNAQQQQQPLNIEDIGNFPLYDKDIDGIAGDVKVRNILSCASIDPQGKVRGVVQAINKTGSGGFGMVDEYIVKVIASQMAMVFTLILEMQVNPERSRIQSMDADYNRKLHTCVRSQEVIDLSIQYIKSWTQTEYCTFHSVNRHGNTMELAEDVKSARPRRNDQMTAFLNRVLRVGGVVVVSDLMFDLDHSKMFEQSATPHHTAAPTSKRRGLSTPEAQMCPNRRSCLGLPLRIHPQSPVAGILVASHLEPSYFSKEMAAPMEKMLSSFAHALERTATLERFVAAQESLPDIFASNEIQSAILASEAIAAKCLHSSSACVYVVNQANGQVWITSNCKTREELKASKGLIGQCLREAERWERESNKLTLFEAAFMNIPDALSDNRFDPLVDDAKSHAPPGSCRPMLLVPIQIPSRPHKLAAVLAVSRCQSKPFSATDEQVARVVSRTMAAAFQNCLSNEIIDHVIQDSQTLLKMTAELHAQQGSMEDLMSEVLRRVVEVLECSSAKVMIVGGGDIGQPTFPENVETEQFGTFRSFRIFEDKVIEEPLSFASIKSPLVRDALSDEILASNCKTTGKDFGSDGWRPMMCCPLIEKSSENAVIGVIEVEREGSSIFSEIDEAKFTFFCQHVCAAVTHVMRAEEKESTIRSLQSEIGLYRKFCLSIQHLTNKPHVESIISAATKLAKDLICCGSSKFFWLLEGDFTKYAGAESFDNYYGVKHEFRGIAGQVARCGNTIMTNNLQEEEYYDAEIDQVREGSSCRNAIAVPVLTSAETTDLIGVLVIYNKYAGSQRNQNQYQFSSHDAEMATLIGNLTTFCLKVSRKQKKHNLLGSVKSIVGKESNAWKDISKASTEIGAQAFIVFETKQNQNRLVCCFPPECDGNELEIGAGLFGSCFAERKAIVNVKDSETDVRVHGEHDSLEFLKLAEPRRHRSASSKQVAMDVKKRMSRKVPWSNALCVLIPSYPDDKPPKGIFLLINKTAEPFNEEDERNFQIMIHIASKQSFETDQRKELNAVIQARSEIIQHASKMFKLRPSLQTIVEMAVAKAKSLIPSEYCAIYLKETFSTVKPSTAPRELDLLLTKTDSDGRVQTERSGDGVHARVYLTGSPIRIDDASGVEAGGIPTSHRKEVCRVLAYPIIFASNVIGVVLLSSKHDNSIFTDSDELLLKDFCVILSVALGYSTTTTIMPAEVHQPEVEVKPEGRALRRRSSVFLTDNRLSSQIL